MLAGVGYGATWEGEAHYSRASSGRAVILCLRASLYPPAAFSLFIPLQGNSLIIIKMSEGIHKYIHTLNEKMPQCKERRGDLWLLGCHLVSLMG